MHGALVAILEVFADELLPPEHNYGQPPPTTGLYIATSTTSVHLFKLWQAFLALVGCWLPAAGAQGGVHAEAEGSSMGPAHLLRTRQGAQQGAARTSAAATPAPGPEPAAPVPAKQQPTMGEPATAICISEARWAGKRSDGGQVGLLDSLSQSL